MSLVAFGRFDLGVLARIAGLAVPLVAWELASRIGILHSVFTPPFSGRSSPLSSCQSNRR